MATRPPRKLPILVERSVREVDTLRTDIAAKFEMKARSEVADSNRTITCHKGCASCCYHPVMISVLEAITIYRWLHQRGKWTDALKVRLKDAADKQYGVALDIWLYAMIPCPLLDEKKECSVYETRPLICRSYYATSDPYYCHPQRLGPQTEILNRTETTSQFHRKQEAILLHHQLHFTAVPIGTALLLAEQVCTGRLGLESVDAEILKEYVEKS